MAYKITVIGGANADIAGTPSSVLRMHDSNPGKISVTPGGVGRNIAENLRNLGCDVSLITAFGGDVFSLFLKENCRSLGIDISLCATFQNLRSSLYMFINDETGDLHTAINDMEIISLITPDYISGIVDKINMSDACVIDANLNTDTLKYIADNVTVPIFADPVSVSKCMKLKEVLPRLTAIKPNRYEYAAYGSVPCTCYVSMGNEGMTVIDSCCEYHVNAPSISVTNTNGCGDTATAAIVYATLNGMDVKSIAEFAVNLASKKAEGKIFSDV